MVEDTGKTQHPGAFKPINLPEPLPVQENPQGDPAALKGRKDDRVAAVERRWRIDDEWWRAEPVSRTYYAVLLASGKRAVIFKNMIDGGWYRQSY